MLSKKFHQGNELENFKSKSSEEAKKACDDKEGCESFGFCTNDGGTYLFDKKMKQDQPVKSTKNDCKTYYRSPKSKHNIICKNTHAILFARN